LHCVAENVKGWLKICTLFLVYSLTWLNLPKDNGHLFYIFLWMMATLATNKKFLKRRWFTWAFSFSPSESYLGETPFNISYKVSSWRVNERWSSLIGPFEIGIDQPLLMYYKEALGSSNSDCQLVYHLFSVWKWHWIVRKESSLVCFWRINFLCGVCWTQFR